MVIRKYPGPPHHTEARYCLVKNQAMVPCLEPKRCLIWEFIPKVIMPSDPSFHFRIYIYIQLIVNKLGIFEV